MLRIAPPELLHLIPSCKHVSDIVQYCFTMLIDSQAEDMHHQVKKDGVCSLNDERL